MGLRGPKPGAKRTPGSGRAKGTTNKKTQDVIDKLNAIGCDPILGMAEIAAEARTVGDNVLAGSMYKELAQYVAPKRKAIEHTGADGGSIAIDNKFEIVFIDPVKLED